MDFILNILEQDYISNVYIGVTGILVAIVIFIAEVIKDQNNELNKKVILYRTNIKENIIDVLLIFFYMLIIKMLKYNQDSDICNFYNIIYLIAHGLLLGFVIMSIYKTGKMFWIALKLNTEKDYFNEELEKYIYEKAIELEKRANNKNNKKHKKEEIEFRKFLKEQEIYFNDESKIKDNSDYEPIYPIKNGIIGKYDYKKLIELSNYFSNQKISEENYVINNKDITAEQWVSDISETSKNTVLTTVVLNLLGLGGSTYKEIKQQENDAKVQKIIDEAEKVIRDENLRIDNTNRLEKRQDLETENTNKVSNLVNQIQEFQKIYSETKEPALQATIQYQIESLQEQLNSINKSSIIEQTTNQNEENLLTNKQVNSQENKIAQNGNIEQVKTNIIDKKIKEYISQEKENFTTNINIDTKVVSNTDEVLINYKNTKEATVFKKAKTVFKSLGRNVFKNGNQDIYVDNSDIKESIHHTLKDNYQKSLLYENLAVYSKLGEVIESAVKISDSNEMKNRKQYSDWEYYVSKVNIDSKPYIVEFDTTMKDGNRHFRLERVYELNKADVTTDSSSNLTPRFECNICFY